MKNLILMTFATMGLMFTSCGEFKTHPVNKTGLEGSVGLVESDVYDKILDTFSCQFQYADEKNQLLYSFDQNVCVERVPDENCFYGDYCTHAVLSVSHKIFRNQDAITFSANFFYDHYIHVDQAGKISMAESYVCDNSSASEWTTEERQEYMQPECVPPQMGTMKVSLLDSQIPVVHSQYFQSRIFLKNGDSFGIICELENAELGTACP